jgi:hypothetical protein
MFLEWLEHRQLCEVTKKGWRGTVAAMLQKHPDKFSKAACKKGYEGDKLCPWAIAHSKAKEDAEPHYKDQESSLKGKPKKKKKFEED